MALRTQPMSPHIADRLGATGQAEAQPLVTAHA